MAKLSKTAQQFLIDGVASTEYGLEIIAAIEAGGGGSASIGSPIGGAVGNQVLYVDGSLNLAQNFRLSFDGQHFNTMFDTVPNRTFGITTNPLIFGFFPGASFNGSDPANGLQAINGIFDGSGFIGSSVVNIRYNTDLNTNDSAFDILTAGSAQFTVQTNVFNGGLSVNGNNGPGLQLIGSSADQFTFSLTAPHNATAGAIYKINSFAFVVMNTIVGGSTLVARNSGSSIPSSGNLTLFSGSGDSTLAYSSFVHLSGSQSFFGIDIDGNIGWNAQGVGVRLPNVTGSIGQVLGITGSFPFLQLGWISAGGGGLALGNPITGGVANRILYSDVSQTLRENDNLQFDGSTLSIAADVVIHNNGILKMLNNLDAGGVQFSVDSGMLTIDKYSWPNTKPVANSGYFLTADTTGAMAWALVGGGGGVTAIGSLDGNLPSSLGLSIVSNNLYAQSASATVAGLVNVSPSGQTMYGNKEFNYTATSTSTNNLVSLLNVNFGSPSTGTQQTAFQATVQLGDVVDHSSDIITAVQGQVAWNGNNVNTINGLLSSINVGSNVQNISNIYGLQNNVINGTQGNTGAMAGTWNYVSYSAPSGTLFNMYGSVAALQGGGASHINNAYGFYVLEVPTALQASNVFGFFDASNSVSQFGKVNLMNASVTSGAGLFLYAGATTGSNAIQIRIPDGIGAGIAYTLPSAPPIEANSYMVSDASGNMSFISPYRTIICTNTVGGSSSETVSAPGLTTSDTICAISQTVAGTNNVPVTGFNTITAGSINVQWSGDPGANAQITLIVRNFSET